MFFGWNLLYYSNNDVEYEVIYHETIQELCYGDSCNCTECHNTGTVSCDSVSYPSLDGLETTNQFYELYPNYTFPVCCGDYMSNCDGYPSTVLESTCQAGLRTCKTAMVDFEYRYLAQDFVGRVYDDCAWDDTQCRADFLDYWIAQKDELYVCDWPFNTRFKTEEYAAHEVCYSGGETAGIAILSFICTGLTLVDLVVIQKFIEETNWRSVCKWSAITGPENL